MPIEQARQTFEQVKPQEPPKIRKLKVKIPSANTTNE
jgi:hypothetical protein